LKNIVFLIYYTRTKNTMSRKKLQPQSTQRKNGTTDERRLTQDKIFFNPRAHREKMEPQMNADRHRKIVKEIV